jgi:hypothetical protein
MRHHHRQFGAAPSDLYNCYRCGALWQTVIRLRVLGRDKWDRYRCGGRTNEMHHRSYYALLACFGASPWHLAMSPHRALMAQQPDDLAAAGVSVWLNDLCCPHLLTGRRF